MPEIVDNANLLVHISFIDRLPKMFDGMKNCKSQGTIIFTPHEVTVVAAEYKGDPNDQGDPEQLKSLMSFSLSNHESYHYFVKQRIQFTIYINDLSKYLNTKAFKSNSKEQTIITFKITEQNLSELQVSMMKKDIVASGQAISTFPIKLTTENQIEYAHNYHAFCARKMSSSDLKDKINSLVSSSHKYCSIRITSTELIISGEGDGPDFERLANLQYRIPIKGSPETANDYCAEGIFELARLKSFVRLSTLAKSVILYVETDKPLLLEYIIARENNVDKDCEICTSLGIHESGQGYVRYVLGSHN